MAANPQYRSSYPRGGQVALLCEGDLVGYEASVLRRWLDTHLGTHPLVDLWPCGTCTAILGVADAIGRSRPIAVIEDRDYRLPEDAQKQVGGIRRRRADRGIEILAWQTWRRNEIENYLIEPEVVTGCLAGAFGCRREDVQEILEAILPVLAVHQAFQHALYQARARWEASDPAPMLPQNLALSPVWDDTALQASTPPFETNLQRFEQNLAQWQQGTGKPLDVGELKREAVLAYERWQRPTLESSFWLQDWAGKDVLQWVRIGLTARFGWKPPGESERRRLSWAGLSRTKRDQQDRPVEADLKPLLVRAFLDHLSRLTDGDLHAEWHGLLSPFRTTQWR